MAHISSIGAGMYSDLSVCTSTTLVASALSAVNAGSGEEAAFKAAFATTTTFSRITNVREFPAMGTPPNVVNVPVYGQKTSSQIQGQSDAPSMEITINYVPSEWASGTALGELVADGKQYAFRFSLLNSEPDGYATATTGLGTVQNSQYFWIGKVDALQVTPQLTDANTATLTITMQTEFFGAYTV